MFSVPEGAVGSPLSARAQVALCVGEPLKCRDWQGVTASRSVTTSYRRAGACEFAPLTVAPFFITFLGEQKSEITLLKQTKKPLGSHFLLGQKLAEKSRPK